MLYSPGDITLNYLWGFGTSLLVAGLLWLVAKDAMVVSFAMPWQSRGSLLEGLGQVWFIFAWAVGVNVIWQIYHMAKSTSVPQNLGELFLKGIWLSVLAGFFEEIIYRWLAFLSAMVVVTFLNFISFGLAHWAYADVLAPLANIATLHALDPQLTSMGWVLAAAVVSVAASFRDAHEYQGFFGLVNSWFGGMVFFWLMFNYGLWTAIVAHILYDLCVTVVAHIMNVWRLRLT